jgi:hypothetical protein
MYTQEKKKKKTLVGLVLYDFLDANSYPLGQSQ